LQLRNIIPEHEAAAQISWQGQRRNEKRWASDNQRSLSSG